MVQCPAYLSTPVMTSGRRIPQTADAAVHMNGRIYDPLLGRFLSADITVQFPGDLQSYNRYSYVRNNPVTAIDPTGWYDVGGHLYATYIIAMAAGFDSDRASRLAHYSNYPDEHRETSASSRYGESLNSIENII